MGITAPVGVAGNLAFSLQDQADAVVAGQLNSVSASFPFQAFGPFNLVVYASIVTTLTTTAGSLAATVASGTGLSPGASISSVLVPPGTTWKTFAGTAGTLQPPVVALAGSVKTSSSVMSGLSPAYPIAGLLNAAAAGPGIPPGTTVTAVNPAAGQVTLSAAPLLPTPSQAPAFFSFSLAAAAILTSGADANAVFTGAAITYSGTLNIERSFDGGSTWIVANTGSGGLAQFTAGTPLSVAFGEPERGVLYRVNCIAYTSGLINYRFSTSGAAASSGGYNQLT